MGRRQRQPRIAATEAIARRSLRLPDWRSVTVVAAGLLAVLVYFNSLAGDFVWDDRKLILDDRAVKSWQHLGEIFSQDFFHRNEDDLPYGYYRPLTTVSYLIDHSIWGLRPWGYHLTNVLLHAACTMMVAVLSIKLRWPLGAAAASAFLFAVHPIHTENVAWIAGRTDLLAFFFCSLAFLSYLAATDEPLPSEDRRAQKRTGKRRPKPPGNAFRSRPWRRHALLAFSLLAFTLALLSKEMSIVLPAWLALAHLFLRHRGQRATVRTLLPYAVVVGGYLAWRFAIIGVTLPGKPTQHDPLVVLLTLGPTVARYLGWLALPVSLEAYVANPYVTSPLDPHLAASLLLLAGLAVLLHRLGRLVPGLALASAMLAASFLPILNVVRVAAPLDMGNVMAERFCYFSSFPFVAIAGLLLTAALESTSSTRRHLVQGFLLGIIAVGSLATVARNRDWRDELTFLTKTLEQNPNAVLLWGNLASYQLDKGNLDAAQQAIERAAALEPESYSVLSSRALWYVVSGRLSEAIPLQQRIAREAARGRTVALNNLAFLYRKTGQNDRALGVLEPLVRNGNTYADVFFNLAEIQRARGQLEEARASYRSALDDRPSDTLIATALATLELHAGRLGDAEEVYRGLLASYPRDARILNNLALIRHRRGDVHEALQLLRRTVSLQPDYARGCINYALLLHAVGRADEALAELEDAARLVTGTDLEQVVAESLEAVRAGRPLPAPETAREDS